MNIRIGIFCLMLFSLLRFNNAYSQPVLASEIPVNYDVSTNGAFQYSIPLRLPPGIKSMVPNLSISYNSQAGNGLLGVGWSLNGLSAITRGSSNIYHDLEVAPADFNHDPLFLDGQRLFEDGSFYMTEIKNFAKIRYFSSGNFFRAEYPNGMKYEYGKTTGPSGSKFIAQGKSDVYMWAVNRIEDAHGNYITFEYINNQSTGDYRISKITYGENASVTGGIPITINFLYASRVDVNATWINGAEVVSNVLLQDIIVEFSDKSQANKYHFTYDVNKLSRLVKIEELRDGSAKLPDININWGTTTSTVNATQINIGGSSNKAITAGDFNGDGYSDIVSYFASGNPQAVVLINDKNGGFASPITVPMSSPISTGTNQSAFTTVNGPGKLSFDYDGDGLDDVLLINFDGNSGGKFFTIWLMRANGNPTTVFDPAVALYYGHNNSGNNNNFHSLIHFAPGDFDGDGKSEVIVVQPYTFNNQNSVSDYDLYIIGEEYSTYTTAWKIDHLYGHIDAVNVLDYNGDGKSEYLINHILSGNPKSSLYELKLAYNASTLKPQLIQTSGSWPTNLMCISNFPHTYLKNWFGDYNGDGKSDVISLNTQPPYNYVMAYSDGTYNTYTNRPPSAVPSPLFPTLNGSGILSSTNYNDHNNYAADFNGDGYTDIIQLNTTSYNSTVGATCSYDLFYSTGTSFVAQSGTNISFHPDPRFTVLGDFNGDGQVDIMNATFAHLGYISLLTFQDNNRTLQVTSIEHAGKTINVNYKTLPQHPNYTKATGIATGDYKHITRAVPFKVVYTMSDDVSMANTYTYQGLWLHKYGLGLKGFEKFNVTNVAGQTIYNTYTLNRRFPYQSEKRVFDAYNGMPYAQRTTYQQIDENGGAGTWSRIIMNYADHDENYVSAQITENTINTGLTTAGNVFYEYGQLASTETRTKDLNNNNFGLSTTTYDYGTSWAANKGKPEKVTTYSELDPAGANGVTSVTSFTYNAAGDIATTTTDPSTINSNTVTYTYGDFGNVIQEDVSANLITPSVYPHAVYEYTSDGKFLKSKKDALQYEEKSDYGNLNASWGNILEETNKQGLKTEFEYDAINRIIRSIDVNHGLSVYTSYGLASSASYTSGLANARFSVTTTNSADGSYSCVITDKYGREIRTVTSDFNGNPVYTDKTYNAIGLTETVTKPYRAASSLSKVETITSFDAYNLPVHSSTSQGGADIDMSYALVGGMLHTTVTNLSTGKTRTSVTCGSTLLSITGNTETIEYTYHGNGTEATIKVNNTTNGGGTSTITKTLDGFGRVYTVVEPNTGTKTYTYDALGRLKYEFLPSPDPTTSSNYEYTYDDIGRVIQKRQMTAPNTTYTYTYYPSTFFNPVNRGLLDEEKVSTGYSYKYDYNAKGELQAKKENYTDPATGIPSTYNQTMYDYYPDGKLKYYTFYNDIRIYYEYNLFGGLNYASVVSAPDPKMTHPLMSIWGKDVFGNFESAYVYSQHGAPLAGGPLASSAVIYDFAEGHDVHGYPTGRRVDRLGAAPMLPNIVKDVYEFNPKTGNMSFRRDETKAGGGGYEERFSYDTEYDRLTNVQYATNPASPLPDLQMDYTDNGNITKKTDVAPTTIHPWKYDKYALKVVPEPGTNWPTPTHTSEIPFYTLESEYYPFGKIKYVEEAAQNRIDFTYGATDERVKAVYYTLSPSKTLVQTKMYGENYERITDAAGNRTELFYVWADEKLIAVLRTYTPAPTLAVPRPTTTGNVYYPVTDHLGSITHFLDDLGTGGVAANGIVEERSYDAWGRMRDPQTWIPYVSGSYPTGLITDRGYTGHEHIALGSWNNNVINMNGRLYDPLVGRMFSPDPYIPDGKNSQDYNKYIYARNNPLKYNDPDGNWVNIVLGAAVGGIVNMGVQYAKGNLQGKGAGAWFKAFGVGAVAGAVAGATFGAGLGVMTGAGVAAGVSGTVAAGTGGFVAGAVAGGASGALSTAILTYGNAILLGDYDQNESLEKQVLKSAAWGAAFGLVTGGLGNGIQAARQGRSFWTGDLKFQPDMPSLQPLPMKELKVSDDFFDGTQYTPKVEKQMGLGDYHSFPESVKAFEKDGVIHFIKGGDGTVRKMLSIPGRYPTNPTNGQDPVWKNGVFEFIKEYNGNINHRFFNTRTIHWDHIMRIKR